jgi:starvation-inducible outer membrane lipoprotein
MATRSSCKLYFLLITIAFILSACDAFPTYQNNDRQSANQAVVMRDIMLKYICMMARKECMNMEQQQQQQQTPTQPPTVEPESQPNPDVADYYDEEKFENVDTPL